MNIEENRQLTMSGYQKFANKDIAGLLDTFTDDIEWESIDNDEIPFAGTYHGKSEVGRYFSELDQAQEAVQFEPREFICEGDKVVVLGQSRWTVRSTGQTYDNPWVHVLTIRDGKVARFQQFNDTASVAKAFRGMQPGLGQQPGQGAPVVH